MWWQIYIVSAWGFQEVWKFKCTSSKRGNKIFVPSETFSYILVLVCWISDIKGNHRQLLLLKAPSTTSRSQDMLKLFPAKRFLARGNIEKCAPWEGSSALLFALRTTFHTSACVREREDVASRSAVNLIKLLQVQFTSAAIVFRL